MIRRYLETLRHLRPEQVRHRAWRQVKRVLPGPGAGGLPLEEPRERSGWGPAVPRPRLPVPAGALSGEFDWWGIPGQVDLHGVWEDARHGRSWNYPVQYHEWLLPFADAAARGHDDGMAGAAGHGEAATAPAIQTAPAPTVEGLCDLLDAWLLHHRPGKGIAWDPYPTALRIAAWVDLLAVLGERAPVHWRRRVLRRLYQQAAWLHERLELDLLGSHLLKDVKALLLASAVLDGPALQEARRTAVELLRRELNAQVHPGGAHLEPSPMYHAMVLGDLLDLLNFRALEDEDVERVRDTARRMLRYALDTATPDGGTPMLGDAWPGAAPTPAQLAAYAQALGIEVPGASPGWTVHADAGIAVWRDARQYLLADVGPIGPDHLAGHGHCDALSFVWWCDGEPWIVDPGTFTYEPGPLRDACRSTRAHNTLEIDDREQHEIWASFRVGRRSQVRIVSRGSDHVEAVLVPWFAPGLHIRRRFTASRTGCVVDDRIEGEGGHRVVSRLHLHPVCRFGSLEPRDPAGGIWQAVVHRGERTAHLRITAPGGTLRARDARESGSYVVVPPGRLERAPHLEILLGDARGSSVAIDIVTPGSRSVQR